MLVLTLTGTSVDIVIKRLRGSAASLAPFPAALRTRRRSDGASSLRRPSSRSVCHADRQARRTVIERRDGHGTIHFPLLTGAIPGLRVSSASINHAERPRSARRPTQPAPSTHLLPRHAARRSPVHCRLSCPECRARRGSNDAVGGPSETTDAPGGSIDITNRVYVRWRDRMRRPQSATRPAPVTARGSRPVTTGGRRP
jgi:hypothetical protein